MKYEIFSYRFAEEIFQHKKHVRCWKEITEAVTKAPAFVFPGKSSNWPAPGSVDTRLS